MYYINPNEIISSLVTPLMDTSKRAREFIVEISLNDAPVRRRIAVAFGHEEILRVIKEPEEYEYERTISEVLHGFYER